MSDEMESMRALTGKLNTRQQRYAELRARGDMSKCECARQAGYRHPRRSEEQCEAQELIALHKARIA